MEEISLTNEQLRLIPHAMADGAQAFRLSSVSSMEQVKVFREATNRTVILAASKSALFVTGLCDRADRTPSLKFSCSVGGHDLGSVFASNDRAAAETIMTLSAIFENKGGRFFGVRRCNTQASDGGFQDQEVEALLTNNYDPGWCVLKYFRFSPQTVLRWTRLERPIHFDTLYHLPESLDTTFMEEILANHESSSFGTLYIDQFCSHMHSEDITIRLASHNTVVFDTLRVNGDTIPSNIIQKLFECRRSVRCLRMFGELPNWDDVLPILEDSMAHGRCPPTLLIEGTAARFRESMLRALASPECRLAEIDEVTRLTREFVEAALQHNHNHSLKRVRFYSLRDFCDAGDQLVQNIVDHPGIDTVYIGPGWLYGGNETAAYNDRWRRLLPFLQRDRRRKIVFEDEGVHSNLIQAFEPAMSLNRFRCGVVDALSAIDDEGFPFCVLLALRNCFRDTQRMALLLQVALQHKDQGAFVEQISENALRFSTSNRRSRVEDPNP